MNFPVINDNRTIGLLRKYRVELAAAQSQGSGFGMNGGFTGNETIDNYNLKIAELEKKQIEDNLEKMRFNEEKQKLVQRMQEMKGKFNDLVQSKADLQAELI